MLIWCRCLKWMTLVLVVGLSPIPAEAQDGELGLATALFDHGIAFPGELTFPLDEPTLVIELPIEDREAALKQLAGQHNWRQFSRNHPNAPTSVRLKSLKDESGQRLGYSVRSTYIAYAPFEKLRDQDLLQASFGADKPEQASFEELSQERLDELGVSFDAESAGVARMQLALLNQVKLQGVVEMQRIVKEDSILLCWRLHPAFEVVEGQEDLENQWAPVRQNSQGDLIVGRLRPYAGLGGFISISQTGVAEDQLLFESQLLIHEPEGWFENPNYLRSKLPLSLQEGAKKFRRVLGQ